MTVCLKRGVRCGGEKDRYHARANVTVGVLAEKARKEAACVRVCVCVPSTLFAWRFIKRTRGGWRKERTVLRGEANREKLGERKREENVDRRAIRLTRTPAIRASRSNCPGIEGCVEWAIVPGERGRRWRVLLARTTRLRHMLDHDSAEGPA